MLTEFSLPSPQASSRGVDASTNTTLIFLRTFQAQPTPNIRPSFEPSSRGRLPPSPAITPSLTKPTLGLRLTLPHQQSTFGARLPPHLPSARIDPSTLQTSPPAATEPTFQRVKISRSRLEAAAASRTRRRRRLREDRLRRSSRYSRCRGSGLSSERECRKRMASGQSHSHRPRPSRGQGLTPFFSVVSLSLPFLPTTPEMPSK